MFKPQFAGLVRSGQKCQTVRPVPERMPKPGDSISLRMWSCKPYRSKQVILRESTVTEVLPVAITADHFRVAGNVLSNAEQWAFAKADGFTSPEDLVGWFAFEHGLPFHGIVIKWSGDVETTATADDKKE